jgi:hypothetical protein
LELLSNGRESSCEESAMELRARIDASSDESA